MDDDEGSSPWADAPSSPPPPSSSRPQTPSIRTSIDAVFDSPSTTTIPSCTVHQPSPLIAQPSSFPSPPNDFEQEEEEDDGFDDFDDPPPAGEAAVEDAFGGDDDFGDFGDFDQDAGGEGFDEVELEGTGGDEVATSSTSFVAPPPPPPSYTPLHLSPFPDAQTLASTVQSILAPIFPDLDPDSQMGSEDVRQVPGLGQVLVDEESRNLYKSLTSVPPLARLDWTRSRVRREHLITLGVPVNLDEVASTKPPSLPTLRISTLQQQSSSSSSNLSTPSHAPDRPTSTPPAPRPNAPKRSNTVTGSSSSTYRRSMSATVATGASAARPSGSGASTPNQRVVGPGTDVDLSKVKGGQTDKTYGLGTMPEMDLSAAKELLDVPSDSLSLLSLPSLQQLHSSLEQTTASASVLLSYLLQLKDAQQHEALISNGLIGELINAQRLAMTAGAGSGSGGGGGWRRSVQVGQGNGRSPGR